MTRAKIVSNVLLGLSLLAIVGLAFIMLRDEDGDSADADADAEQADAAAPDETPDLIFITIDTLRSDGIGAYGNPAAKTPNIDGLAREGVLFQNSVTAFPRTTPGMGSLFTGLWPHHHGSREVWEKVEKGTFLTELLHDRGYQTIGMTSNGACGHKQGFARGFDHFVRRKQFEDNRAGYVTDKALELLAEAKPDAPLFLWVHYTDPHWPYLPPRSYKDQPKAPGCRALMHKRHEREKVSLGQIQANHEGMSAAVLDECRAMYDATITYTDAEIGRLIEGLQASDRWSEAVVVLTADHGENMGEDGYYYAHGPSLAAGSLQVPLIFKGPGIPTGEVDDGLARGVDVMPTILQLLGQPPDSWPQMDGQSLTWRWDPAVDPPAHPIDYAYAESATEFHTEIDKFVGSGRPGKRYCVHDQRYSMCVDAETEAANFYDRPADPLLKQALDVELVDADARARLEAALETWPQGTARQRMIRTKQWKLVERPLFAGGYEQALYDVSSGAPEARDLRADNSTRALKLEKLLHRWLEDLPAYEAEKRSSEALRELRALGYIGD